MDRQITIRGASDHLRGRMPFGQRNQDEPSPRLLNFRTANDFLRLIIPPLHKHVGQNRLDECERGVGIKNRDSIHAFEHSENLGAVVLGVDRT